MPEAMPSQGTRRLGTARLVLRPFGYLLIGLVWSAIGLVILALGPGLSVVWGIGNVVEGGAGGLGGLPAPDSFGAWVGGVLAFVLLGPLLVALWGLVVLWMLPWAGWPLAALSFVYMARALRPSYAADPLSRSEYVTPGGGVGPLTIGSTSLSLQPVRQTRLTTFLMMFYLAGWKPTWDAARWMLLAGVGYLLTFPALALDLPWWLRLACAVPAVGLHGFGYVRALRVTIDAYYGRRGRRRPRGQA